MSPIGQGTGAPAVEPLAYEAVIQAFADVASALGDFTDRDALLHLVGARICGLIKAERCSVYLRESKTRLFRGQVGYPPTRDAEIKRLVAGVAADGFTREIVATRRPVVVADTATDPRPVRSAMRAWRVRSMLGVPMVLRDEVIGIVFLDNEDMPHVFAPAEQAIAAAFANLAAVAISQAEMTAELRANVTIVARQNEALRRATVMDDRFAELLLRGSTLDDVARSVAELTRKPVAVYDARLDVLAAAPAPGRPEIPRLLGPEVREHPRARDALADLEGMRPAIVGPLREANLTHRLLVAPISLHGRRWGHVVVGEYGSRLDALDRHVVRRAAMLIATEFSIERRVGRSEWEGRASLARDLLAGGADHASLERRSHLLGIDLATPRAVVAIASRRPGVRAPSAREAVAALCGLETEPDVLGIDEERETVLLAPLDGGGAAAPEALRERLHRAFDGVSADGWLAIGVSTACTRPSDYARAGREAYQVLRCIQIFAERPGLVSMTADELGPARALLGSSDRDTLDGFARDTLGPLLDDTDPGMRDLLSTLDIFFSCSRSVRGSAAALEVHENTIRHRLARVESLIGLAVASNADDQMTVQLALMVLRLEGRLMRGVEQPPIASDTAP
jgi:sugar diacid utilization regulator